MAKWSVQYNQAGDGKHFEHTHTVEADDEEGAYAAAGIHPTKRRFFAVAPLNDRGNVTMTIAGHSKSEKEVAPMKKHDSISMNVVQERLGLTYEETIDLDDALRNGSIPQLRKFSAVEDLGGETSENLKKMAPNIKKWTSLIDDNKRTPTKVLNDPKVKELGDSAKPDWNLAPGNKAYGDQMGILSRRPVSDADIAWNDEATLSNFKDFKGGSKKTTPAQKPAPAAPAQRPPLHVGAPQQGPAGINVPASVPETGQAKPKLSGGSSWGVMTVPHEPTVTEGDPRYVNGSPRFLGRSEIKSQVIEMINGQIATLVELQKREVEVTNKCPLCEQDGLNCACVQALVLNKADNCLLCNQSPTMCECISKLEKTATWYADPKWREAAEKDKKSKEEKKECPNCKGSPSTDLPCNSCGKKNEAKKSEGSVKKSGPVPVDGCAKCGKKTPELRGTWGMTCSACSEGSDEGRDESSLKPTQKPASLRNSEESPEESSSEESSSEICKACKSEMCKCMEKNTPKNPTRQTQQKKDKLDDAARMKKLGASKGQYKEAVKTGFIHDPKVASKKSEDFIDNKNANKRSKSTDEAKKGGPRIKNVGAENDNPSEVPGKEVGGDEGSGGEVKGKGSEKKLDKAGAGPAGPPTAKPPKATAAPVAAAPKVPTASAALAGKPKAGAPPALKAPTPGKLKLSELSLQSSKEEWMEELAKAGFGRNALSAAAGRHGASAGLKPGYQQSPKAVPPPAMPQTSMGDRAVITQAANKRVIPGAAGKVPGTVDANTAGFQKLINKPAPASGLAGLMARYKTRISGA
jgi:hypothetical protein